MFQKHSEANPRW